MYAQPFSLYGNPFPHWIHSPALDNSPVNYACRSPDLVHPRLPFSVPAPAPTFADSWSSYASSSFTDSDSASSLSNSPVQQLPHFPRQSYFPTPVEALAARNISAYSRPPQAPPQLPPSPPTQPAPPPASKASLTAFRLTNLEPLDASDDPFPVSMQDIIQPKEEVEYHGLSYRFALSTSSGPSSGRNSPSSDDTPDLPAKNDRDSDHAPSRRKMKVKMHTCTVCNKMFPRPSGLKTHMNSHSGDKPFTCPVANCAKSFTVRSNAKRHLRTHGIFPPPPRPAAATGTVDFDTPVVAEEIAHTHFDDRKVRIRWVGDNKDKEKKCPASAKAEPTLQKRTPSEALWDPGNVSRGKAQAPSHTLAQSYPSTMSPIHTRTAAPRLVTSAPSISVALGPDPLRHRTF
ncbi:hypothetical protein OF83DRAFT_1091219 [Amylostereum chailletii]|nr:hypothetical protein OF83DRAFT_1091219 [Amylostereum chailletii]